MKTRKEYYLRKVNEIFPMRQNQSGEVGIEVECEGVGLAMNINNKHWAGHEDGSLREGVEYVLKAPVSRDTVIEALNSLHKLLEGKKLIMSERTSVHVHLNFQTWTMKDVYKFITLFLIFDALLVEYCGPNRKGNLFCLRAQDAEFLVESLRLAVRDNDYSVLASDNLRYSSMNVRALAAYGSIEFRSFRGTADPREIAEWVDLLLCVKDGAERFNSPHEIINSFSELGSRGLLERIFPRAELNRVLTIFPGWQEMMRDGMRLAQDVAYASNWDATDKTNNLGVSSSFDTEFNQMAAEEQPVIREGPFPIGGEQPWRWAGNIAAEPAALEPLLRRAPRRRRANPENEDI